jgi:branched-chain amino acid transport system ATP-binding protein
MSDVVLKVEELRSWYGRSQVLWDLGFTVHAGEGLGIIGHNGAGKSTLLRTIAGVHERMQGSIQLLGQDVLGRRPHDISRRGLTLVREGAPVFGDLTIVENLAMGATLAARRNRTPLPMSEVWEVFPVLNEMSERKAGYLSGGQRQMLALATSFVSQPSILLLDEPSAGLAPEAAATAFEAVSRMRQAGLCIVIAEQNIEWLAGVTSHTFEIESGRMVRQEELAA